MELRRAKLSDPNYVRLTVANLDTLFPGSADKQESKGSANNNPNQAGTSGDTSAAAGGIDTSVPYSHFSLSQEHPFNPDSDTTQSNITGSFDFRAIGAVQEKSGAQANAANPSSWQLPAMAAPGEANASCSVSEAADIIGLDSRSVLGLIAIGQLPAFQEANGQWRINLVSLRPFVKTGESNKQAAVAASDKDAVPSVTKIGNDKEEPIDKIASDSPAPMAAAGNAAAQPLDLQQLILRFEDAQSQLESASYRIGFLEAELSISEQKLKLMPDMQSYQIRLLALERENIELARRLERLEQKSSGFWSQLLDIFKSKRSYGHLTAPAARQVLSDSDLLSQRKTRREFY